MYLFRYREAANAMIEVIVDQEDIWSVLTVGSPTDGGLAITHRDRIASPAHQQSLYSRENRRLILHAKHASADEAITAVGGCDEFRR